MLPDFPRQKRKMWAAFERIAWASRWAAHPLLAQIAQTPVYEGDRMGHQRAGEAVEETRPEELRAAVPLTPEETRAMRFPEVLQAAVPTGGELGGEQEKALLRAVEEATRQAGTQLDARGEPLTPELILQMLEMIEIDFDEAGKPRPFTVMPLEMHDAGARALLECKANPKYAADYKRVMDRKRAEWREREDCRRLVD